MQMIMPYALNGDSSTFQAHTSTLVKDVRYYNQIADDAGGAGFMAKSALHLFQLAAAMGANQTLVPELYDTLSALDGTQS